MPRILKRPMFSRGGRIGLAEGDPNPGMMGRLGSALPKEKYKPDLMTIKATLNQVYTNAGGSEDGSGYAAVLNFMKENPEYKVQILENMIADKGNQIRVAPLEKESVNILDSLNEDMDGIIKIDMDKLGGRLSENDIQRQQQESNKGIMTGLVDRTELSNGSPFTAERTSADVKAMMDAMNEYAPVTKQRLNLGKVGLNLASGKYSGGDLISTLAGAGSDIYDDYTTKDDAYRAAIDKRKQAAVSSSLAQQLKEASVKPKDARTNLMKELEAVYGKDSPQYKAALEKLVLKDLKPKDERTKLMKEVEAVYGKDSPEYKAALEKLVLKDLKPKDERTNFQKDLESAGIFQGTEEYNDAVKKKYLTESKTKAEKNALALGLKKGSPEYNQYIKDATYITNAAMERDIQSGGVLIGKAARDKVIENQSFVKTVRANLDDVTKLLTEDQSLGGASGSIRRLANKLATATEGFGVDVKSFMPTGLEDKVFDTEIARLSALEALIAPAYARVIFPGQRMTNYLVQLAQDRMNLTGLTGTEEILARLEEVVGQFDNYIKNNEVLLGNQPVYKDDIKKFKIVDGKLVEIVE